MDYIIVAFASRTVSARAYNYLIQHNISCSIISTPREANVGCGLSVQFSERDYGKVYELIGTNANSFYGYFRVSNVNGKRIVTRI